MTLYTAHKYTYRIVWSAWHGCLAGVCTEFPELQYLAKEFYDALAGIISRVAEALEEMRNARQEPPKPLVVSIFR